MQHPSNFKRGQAQAECPLALLEFHTDKLDRAVPLPASTSARSLFYSFHLVRPVLRPTRSAQQMLLHGVARGYVRRKPMYIDLQAVSISARQPFSAQEWHENPTDLIIITSTMRHADLHPSLSCLHAH